MCKISLSKKMYDYLVWHVDEIEKEQELLFKELYTEETHESKNFKAFFREYLDSLNSYLSKASVGPGGKSTCPFVIIGSIVDVLDSDDMEEYKYRVVLPYASQQDTGIDYASCLSPLGRSLLFKCENENISIQIPTGELHYLVKKITIPEASTSNSNDSTDILSPVFTTARSINI
ncbi:MAG: GreA/GreB family elongation factor [Clostridiaceae bacterium]|nr:GreA/GreB family elongation factor [Clostridiaceae bacterium]